MNPVDLKAQSEAVLAPIHAARGLPNEAYTDQAVFAFERDAVLGRSWASIAYARDLPETGSVLPVDFMGLPLLVLRDATGDVRVFHNVCSHRGRMLVDAPGIAGKLIRCPYHSWSYDLSGRLVATPHIGGVGVHRCDGFETGRHGLKPVRSVVWTDIVFVNLSGDAESFDEYIAPVETRWSEFVGPEGFDALRAAPTGSRLDLEVASNWKLPVENYCEAYHLPWIHPGLNAYSPLDQHYAIVDGNGMSGQGTKRYQPDLGIEPPLPRFVDWPKARLRHAEYLALYPNTLLGLQVDHVYSVILQPLAPGATLEKMQLSYVGDASTGEAFAENRNQVKDSWDVVFREDVGAVEGM